MRIQIQTLRPRFLVAALLTASLLPHAAFADAGAGFREVFHRAPDVVAKAPGRVNTIGDHTDNYEGLALPVRLEEETTAAIAARSDNEVHIYASDESVRVAKFVLGAEVKPQKGVETADPEWLKYIQAATYILRQSGYKVDRGFDLHISSKVPVGKGLSSSAALLVSLIRGLRKEFGLKMDGMQVAKLAQRAEREFVGAPIGIMDQISSSLGRKAQGQLIDFRNLAREHIKIPSNVELLIVDSGERHHNSDGSYAKRGDETRNAQKLLGKSLRDFTPAELAAEIAARPGFPAVEARRATHVVTENERVRQFKQALLRGDVETMGRLQKESHESLSKNFQVTTPTLDRGVDVASEYPEVYGLRMTGGGGGGCWVMTVKRGTAAAVGQRFERDMPGAKVVTVIRGKAAAR